MRYLTLALALLTAACAYGYDRPDFDRVAAPASFAVRPALTTAATPDTIALGRQLFADTGLSADGSTACATCHRPDRGFTDGFDTARGEGGRRLVRHTPTLFNVAYASSLFWDGRSPSLEDQALRPITSGGEMGRHPAIVVETVATRYRPLFEKAFPGTGVTEANIAAALAAYQRTLVSGTAPFDRFIAGNRTAITPAAARGFALFIGKAHCAACHSGWLLSDGKFHDAGLPDDDLGRGGISNNKAFDHAFRTPSLREIGRTAPYMHNGSLATLEAVVDHYAEMKVRRRSTPPPISLDAGERRDLVAFLRSLDSDTAATQALPQKESPPQKG